MVESMYPGDIAVVDAKGNLLYSVGDAQRQCYLRSSAKPFQALNLILSGAADSYSLTPKEIAIICASHYAEPQHLLTVKSILRKIGLNPQHILGGTVPSLKQSIALQHAYDHAELDPTYSDCSGKHAGMLTVCQHMGYSLPDYLSPIHPAQLKITQDLAYLCQIKEEKVHIGIDGCSAPAHALPLYNMALGYARFANPVDLKPEYANACDRIFKAMNVAPFMISGTEGFSTALIQATGGRMIGKIGAEGMYGIGIKAEGIGIAIKIASGSMNVIPPVAIQVLNNLGLLNENELIKLDRFRVMDNLNDVKKVIGEIRPVFQLQKP